MNFLLNMNPEDKVMVFVGTKSKANHISSELALHEVSCVNFIQGDHEQCDREQARSKYGDILIATDVASHGIDIQDIT